MFKRLFFLVFGLGLGLLVGAFLVRRMDEATRAVAPTNLAAGAGRAAGTFASRLRGAIDEGRRAMAEHEAQLRAEFHVPTLREALGE